MSPVFAHGQLRLYLLSLLDEAPRHGYEVIRALEERFDGLYTPSAGSIYPRLARLEEEGLVLRTDEGRTAVYRITDAGRDEVSGRAQDVAALQHELDLSVRRLAADVRDRVRAGAKDLRRELRDAAREARANARAVGDPMRPGGRDDPARDVERALRDFAATARAEARRADVDARRAAAVQAVLDDAARRVRDVLTRGG